MQGEISPSMRLSKGLRHGGPYPEGKEDKGTPGGKGMRGGTYVFR